MNGRNRNIDWGSKVEIQAAYMAYPICVKIYALKHAKWKNANVLRVVISGLWGYGENLNFFIISLSMSAPPFHISCFQMTFSVSKITFILKGQILCFNNIAKMYSRLWKKSPKKKKKKEFQHNFEQAVPWNKWIRWMIWRNSIHFVVWFLAYHQISHDALIIMSIDGREC